MGKTWILAALLPLLVSCDAWQAQWEARRKCERGMVLISGAVERMQHPALSLEERRKIRSDLFDGLFLIRSGTQSSVRPGFLYKPDKYDGMATKAAFLMMDPRVAETSSP